MADHLDLKFRIGPHAIEDLGSNLYTSFPRVLAEFVANAYDADASRVDILVDFEKIDGARKAMRKEYRDQMAEADGADVGEPLSERFLPDAVVIEIEDDGFGMSVGDLNDRYLWTARRRRDLPPIQRTKTGRPLMGRKGLGKLAGFGVARRMEVITKTVANEAGTQVTLDYDQILKEEKLTEVPVPAIPSDRIGSSSSGTIVRLSRLAFEGVKSRKETIERELAEQFEFIDPQDFRIFLNGEEIGRPSRDYAYGWPDPDQPVQQLVAKTLNTEQGPITFEYRLRFHGDKQALPADKRGVRVYAHNRMAATPSLLDADTNMHGFRMTDYLNGVAKADFIDEQPQDYIATDRQSLRWDTPLLAPLRDFLSEEVKSACSAYQAVRDEAKELEIAKDEFTVNTIATYVGSARETKLLKRIATSLASICKRGVSDPKYKELLPSIVSSFGQGQLYAQLTKLADQETLDLRELITHVVALNRIELDRSTSIVRSRLQAISTLKKAVETTIEDKEGRNEPEIQAIFETAPWLINPLYHDYLTADKSLSTTLKNLAKHLGVADATIPSAIKGATQREADFAFLLGDDPLTYVVIVEIKASNKAAEVDDIIQLRDYIATARKWLDARNQHHVRVFGELICDPPSRDSKNKQYRGFHNEVDRLTPSDDHRVRSFIEVVAQAEVAHQYILKIADAVEAEEETSDAATVSLALP